MKTVPALRAGTAFSPPDSRQQPCLRMVHAVLKTVQELLQVPAVGDGVVDGHRQRQLRPPAPPPEGPGLKGGQIVVLQAVTVEGEAVILKPDKKLEKRFIAQSASGFYETWRRMIRAPPACKARGISNKAFYLKSVSKENQGMQEMT